MSKSLKNFVTVRELLNGDDAVDPEAFRIFCGLHRYASTVSYSRVKLAEADAARRDFDAALRAARNALSGDLSRAPRRWTDRERRAARGAPRRATDLRGHVTGRREPPGGAPGALGSGDAPAAVLFRGRDLCGNQPVCRVHVAWLG